MRQIKAFLVLTTLAVAGCNQTDTRTEKLEARITALEARITTLETKSADLQQQIAAAPAPSRPAPAEQAVVTRTVSSDVGIPMQRPGVRVVSLSGRVTEMNDVWWKWSYLLVVANTNDEAVTFDANIQFLDRDGYVVQEKQEYGLNLQPNCTNRITGYDMINPGPAAQVKSLKGITTVK